MSNEATSSHVGICVRDLEASLRFYCEGLGFTVAEGYDLDESLLPGLGRALEVDGAVKVRSQMITKGTMKVELLAYDSPQPTGAPSTSRGQLGLTHLNFIVTDTDAVAARLVAAGGTILEHTDVEAGVRLLFVADPDGTRIELMRY